MDMHVANIEKKKFIGKAMAVFLIIMVLLTFFSNTLNNFLSPKVSWENPESGQLVKEVSGTGKVRAKLMLDRYIESEMKVLDIKVKAGETVKKGQLLLELDTSKLQEQLDSERLILQQKKLTVEKIIGDGSDEKLYSYDNAIEAAKLGMGKAERDYENLQALFEAGAEPEINVKDAALEYEKSKMEYKKALDNKASALKANKTDLQNAMYELEMQKKKIDKYLKEMELGRITAPADGTILTLNFPRGTIANNSKPLFQMADLSKGFEFYTTVGNKAADLLSIGDTAEVTLDRLEGFTIEGTVTDIFENQEERGAKKDITIDIPADNLIGGESGTADIKKNSKIYDALVSNSAVGQDISGYFVYVVNERKGPLGNEFFIEKVKVSVGESDNMQTVITSGVGPADRVITGSDKQISDGMRVVLADD